jgi:lysophospholipase L1-like esterase
MRIPLALLLAAAAWCQQPSAPQPAAAPQQPAIPGALQSVYQLINDYGNTRRYAADNAKVSPPAPGEERVVFMGDSITDGWGRNNNGSSFFPGKPYINRGISGQVTPQMLMRFYADVAAHKPRAVVMLAGTNDIGAGLGPVTLEFIENNLMAMADIARANNIKVIFASVMPVCDYHQPQTARRPPERILALNQWVKQYTARTGAVYLDYFTAMVDEKGFLKAELTGDGLHPNAAGYEVMGPLAEKAIAQALGK